MQKHLITLACLLAAMGFYFAGFHTSAFGLVIVGMIAELTFWVRLLRPDRPTKNHP